MIAAYIIHRETHYVKNRQRFAHILILPLRKAHHVDSRDFVKALTSDLPREQWNKLTDGLSQLQLKDILKMALPIALAVVTGGLVTI